MGDKLKDPSLMTEIGSLQIAPASAEGAEEVLEAKETEEGDEEEEEMEEEDEEEDEGEDDLLVTLGFAEKPKSPKSLLRYLFPSKAGGVPVHGWILSTSLRRSPERVASVASLFNSFFRSTAVIKLVYAPLSEKQAAFHRTLFMFMCPSMGCLLRDQHEQWKQSRENPPRSVKVFRCQLPRSNPFYSSEPPKYDGSDKPSGAGGFFFLEMWTLQFVVGVAHGKETKFVEAAKEHVTAQRSIRLYIGVQDIEVTVASLFPLKPRTLCQVTAMPNYQKDVKVNVDQKSLASFQERISNAPEQILRIYCMPVSFHFGHTVLSKLKFVDSEFGPACNLFETLFDCIEVLSVNLYDKYCRDVKSKPLWPLMTGRPSKADIPKCNYCRGPLCYEFQILPQLLYYFGVRNDADSLDWATIVVYTCMASCEEGMEYKEECAWVQLYAQSSF
ncbi:hypothetical protein Taro_035899 [Colocasia esculenta]|uniref:Programmed cell death protein 2 C-terminal domain-containing protein n=1 Tax=Colocasia esculenta TaxID=4460 RepID=A0A843W823_COLES|nr:hypothetical protein [Colocasia esculenta]